MSENVEATAQELLEILHRMRHMRPPFGDVSPDITQAETSALVGISMAQRRHGFARPAMVAGRLHVSKGAFSQVLKSLEEKGLITRRKSDADSRGVELRLTDAGQEFMSQVDKRRDDFARGLFDYIGAEELEHLVATGRKIIEYQENAGFQDVAPAGPGAFPSDAAPAGERAPFPGNPEDGGRSCDR